MTLQWTVDHDMKRVRAVGHGVLSRYDIPFYIAVIDMEDALGYRAVLDFAHAVFDLRPEELLPLLRASGKRNGAIALILPPVAPRGFAGQLTRLADPARPCRICVDAADAESWFECLDDDAAASHRFTARRSPAATPSLVHVAT